MELPGRFERPITYVATSCLSAWLWKRLAPGRGFEPQPTGSKPMMLTVTPARTMVRKVRFELTRPSGHQSLSLARLPFRHMRILVGRVGFEPTTFPMSRFYGPLASTSLHTYPCGSGGGIRTRMLRRMRPFSYLSNTLQYCAPKSGLVLEKGLEPLPCGLSIRCSAD